MKIELHLEPELTKLILKSEIIFKKRAETINVLKIENLKITDMRQSEAMNGNTQFAGHATLYVDNNGFHVGKPYHLEGYCTIKDNKIASVHNVISICEQ